MLAERPELVNPINLVRMCHQAATIHNERRGNPRGVMPEATALLRKLGPLICGRMTGFKAQEVSNTAWAYATLNVSDGALFSALSHRAQSIIGDFKAQGVSNTAWPYAALNIWDSALFSALSHRAQNIIGDFKAQEVSNTAWAYARLNVSDTDLFSALSRRAQNIIGDFKAQEVSNTAWAYATLNVCDTDLFSALSRRAQSIIGDFKAQEVSNAAWAYATLNVCDTDLFSALSRRAQSIIGDFKAQEVSNAAWALAVHVPELVSSVVSAEHLEREDYCDIQWLQLYQALIAAEIVPTDADRYERYRRIVASYERSDPSRFENSIGAALQKALSSTEYSIEFGRIFAGVVTDWVVEFDGRKVVVECDGTDYHTTRGPDAGRRLGKDILQDRIFARFGYEAIHIDSGEWGQAPDGVALLRERLGI
jgi:hypothetical protein